MPIKGTFVKFAAISFVPIISNSRSRKRRLFNTDFKFISKHLMLNMLSTRNHPYIWLPWINLTRTIDRADTFEIAFHENSATKKN